MASIGIASATVMVTAMTVNMSPNPFSTTVQLIINISFEDGKYRLHAPFEGAGGFECETQMELLDKLQEAIEAQFGEPVE